MFIPKYTQNFDPWIAIDEDRQIQFARIKNNKNQELWNRSLAAKSFDPIDSFHSIIDINDSKL